jgi:hypothetical protein
MCIIVCNITSYNVYTYAQPNNRIPGRENPDDIVFTPQVSPIDFVEYH